MDPIGAKRPTKTCKQYSLSEKFKAINDRDSGTSVKEVCEKYGVGRSTFRGWYKEKEAIIKANNEISSSTSSKRSRISAPQKYQEINDALLIWYRQMRSNNAPIDGTVLMEKANMFASEMGYADFKGSEGWLWRFKHRAGITFRE